MHLGYTSDKQAQPQPLVVHGTEVLGLKLLEHDTEAVMPLAQPVVLVVHEIAAVMPLVGRLVHGTEEAMLLVAQQLEHEIEEETPLVQRVAHEIVAQCLMPRSASVVHGTAVVACWRWAVYKHPLLAAAAYLLLECRSLRLAAACLHPVYKHQHPECLLLEYKHLRSAD